mgnify:FL=1
MTVAQHSIIDDILKKQPIISNMVIEEQVRTMLEELQSILQEGIEGDVVEMGCHMGTSSLFLQRLLKIYESDKAFHVYDSFEGLPKQTREDTPDCPPSTRHNFKEGNLQVSREKFVKNFVEANVDIPILHKGFFKDIPNSEYPKTVSFAFFDGDFYGSIMDSFTKIYPRMSVGGKICIHDYEWQMLPGVAKACEDFLADKPEKGTITIRNSLAWITKLEC